MEQNNDWLSIEEVIELTGYQKSRVYELKDDVKITELLGEPIKFDATGKLKYFKPHILKLIETKKQQKKQTRIISIMNQKGGVGKTTSAINVAIILAKKGNKTLLIDLDYVQGNTTSIFSDSEHPVKNNDKNLFSFFDNVNTFDEVIHPTRIENLFIAPSSIRIAEIDLEKINKSILKKALETSNYDYVIMDLPPSLSSLTYFALISSTDILIPVPPGLFEIEGLVGIKKSITIAKRYNPNLNILGAFITIAEPKTKGFKVIKETLPSYFPLAETYIRKRESVKNAYLEKKAIVEVDTENEVSKDYFDFVKEVFNE